MITFLQGRLVDKQPTRVVVDVGGVGYEVTIPLSSYDRVPAPGETFRILTRYHVREDAHQLFGFMTDGERRMFDLLLAVSGIGPRIAMCALSGLSARELKVAIVEGDTKRLSSISGIGKKLAERMVVELRDRIGKGEALEAIAGPEDITESDRIARDAVMALISLGYKQVDARAMIGRVMGGGKASGTMTVEDVVRTALGGTSR